MVLVSGQASFVMLSVTETAASLTERLDLVPTQSWEIGQLVGRGVSGRRHDNAGWVIDVEVPDSKEPWDAALLLLTEMLRDREPLLKQLRRDWSVHVRCCGDSDSSQGGFWLSAQATERLGSLGAEFFGSVHFEDGPIN
jgi:hypothetical protein